MVEVQASIKSSINKPYPFNIQFDNYPAYRPEFVSETMHVSLNAVVIFNRQEMMLQVETKFKTTIEELKHKIYLQFKDDYDYGSTEKYVSLPDKAYFDSICIHNAALHDLFEVCTQKNRMLIT